MEGKDNGGRKAQGQNGRKHQKPGDCRLPSRDSRIYSLNDVMQSKPKGSCVIDEGHSNRHTELNICTYNTRTLRTDESLESLLDELQNFKWDIIGLCETKRDGEGVVELQGGAWLFNKGKTEDNKDAKGIGFLIHPKFKDFVKEMKCHSNRVISLKIHLTGDKQLCIIQVYAPTSQYDDEVVEEVYEDVSKVMEESKAEYTIVMGDFNAKIGRCQPGEESIMGKFGVGERNERGDMLLEFAAQQGLVIANTYFKKNKNRYWTWESPDGNTKNQIDFILSSQRGIVEDCGVITNVDIGSDHRMIRARIHINRKLARLKIIRNRKKSKLNILRLRERRQDFQLELKNRFEGLEIENADIDTKYELISSTLIQVAEEIAPRERKTKYKSEEDKVIEDLDGQRKKLREVENKSPQQRIKYTEIVKTVRKKRRERSRRRRKEQIEIILESGRGPKQITKMNNKKTRISQMKQKDGTITTDREEILTVCAEFYQDLYSSKKEQDKTDMCTKSTDQTDLPNITVKEVELAVKQMKENKAPGTDDITSDIFKIGGDEIYTQLAKLYNNIIQEKTIPKCWKDAKIILLHKKKVTRRILRTTDR